MILEQHYLGCLAQASYFIADEETGEAAVVDPRRDVGIYLEAAEKAGLTIRHVLLTHFHADFLAGHLELREKTGARIHLGTGAQAEYEFDEMCDGETLSLGRVELRFLSTPGHTPESTSIVVTDTLAVPNAPHAVLTGDTLFIGDVGRPDLMASVGLSSEELAGMMYDSLHQKLMTLPDETLVYPGHGAGSMCGKNLSTDTVSTIGAQRATNYALQSMPKEDFVCILTANQPMAPAYFPFDAERNRSEHPVLEDVLESARRPLSADEVARAQADGAQLLDCRDAELFARGHWRESINIGLEGKYATWAGTVLEEGRSIVVVAEPGTEHEAALRLGRIGFDRVLGHLEGGFEATPEERRATHRRIEVDDLRRRLDEDPSILVVDVRQPGEWEAGHIEGARHAPLVRIAEWVDELPKDRPLVCICKSGYRSSSAASLLLRAGYDNVVDVRAGMDAWSGVDACPT